MNETGSTSSHQTYSLEEDTKNNSGGIEMRPHQGRTVGKVLSVTFKLILKAHIELTIKRGENLLSGGNSLCKGPEVSMSLAS